MYNRIFYLWLVDNFSRGNLLINSLPRADLERGSHQEDFVGSSDCANLFASLVYNGEDIIIRKGPFNNDFLLLQAHIVRGDWLKVSYLQTEEGTMLTSGPIILSLL